MARVSTVAQSVWEKAKNKSDFELFRPHLERLVELRQQYADFFKPWNHVYDPLLDDFEPGMKTAEVQTIFNALRPKQVELIKAISQAKKVDRSFLFLDYPEAGNLHLVRRSFQNLAMNGIMAARINPPIHLQPVLG